MNEYDSTAPQQQLLCVSCLWFLSVSTLLSDPQGAHCEERLRIEIVNLREQLDTRTEENGLWIPILILTAILY